MLKPYDLPMLPISFDPETELHFYKKTVEANVNLEALKSTSNDPALRFSFTKISTSLPVTSYTAIFTKVAFAILNLIFVEGLKGFG